MQLDFASMAILITINLGVMGLALPLVMGSPISRAAQHAQRYFVLQAVAWALILSASRVRGTSWDMVLSVGATCAASAALWQMAQALQQWLGPRPLRRWLLILSILAPAGFAVLFQHSAWRMAWYSLCHALMITSLGWMCLRPRRTVSNAWRYLMAACSILMAAGLFTRAYLAGWTPWLQDFAQDNSVNHVFALIAQLCGTLFLVSMLVAWRDETNQKLRDMAMTDQLTGLANRHALLQKAPEMQAHAHRQKIPLALVLLDIDYFKTVNDQHGHVIGDQALQLLAQVLRQHTRGDEIASRWGGEEFCLLLYAQTETVEKFYQRLSEALQAQSLHDLGFGLQLSAGCAIQMPHYSYSLTQLLQYADAALYTAKSQGRGQLSFQTSPLPPPLAPACTLQGRTL